MNGFACTQCFTLALAFLVTACASNDSTDGSETTDLTAGGDSTQQPTTSQPSGATTNTGGAQPSPTEGATGAGTTGGATGSTGPMPSMPGQTGPGDTGPGDANGGSGGEPTGPMPNPTEGGTGAVGPVDPSPSAAGGNGTMGDMPSSAGGAGGEMAGMGGNMAAGGAPSMPVAQEPRCPREMTEGSKAVVDEGITQVFVNGNGSVIRDYWDDPYIQHNPAATSGVATFEGFFGNVSAGFYSMTRLIGECDLVLIHGSYQGNGATFDMLRVDQDKMKMVEHWDAAMSGGGDLLGGPTEVEDLELTEQNRALVLGLIDEMMIGGDTSSASVYLADDLVVHGGGRMNGADAFVQRFESGSISYSTVHHQIAEGNFVFTLSEGTADGTAYGFWDLFRVADGLIVEHWDARLTVQAGASGEGIF